MVFESDEVTGLGTWSASSIQAGERRVGSLVVSFNRGREAEKQPQPSIRAVRGRHGISIKASGGDSEKKGVSGLG